MKIDSILAFCSYIMFMPLPIVLLFIFSYPPLLNPIYITIPYTIQFLILSITYHFGFYETFKQNLLIILFWYTAFITYILVIIFLFGFFLLIFFIIYVMIQIAKLLIYIFTQHLD